MEAVEKSTKKTVEETAKRIIEWLKNYKETTGCRGVVLGISGGKDSTVVAMLAKKVWGDNVVGVLMPNGQQKDLQDSINIVKALNLRHYTVDIFNAYLSLITSIESQLGTIISAKSLTNIPPRLRMTTLYAIAQTLGYRVIGTGNFSEAYVGWTTKWGDSACDFNPIAHLTCSDVMELGKYLAEEFNLDKKYVTKTPSDGLSGKSDEENFGFTYDTLDCYLTTISRNPTSPLIYDSAGRETINKIESMHSESAHKRSLPLTINTH